MSTESQLTIASFFKRYRYAYLAGAFVLLATNLVSLSLPYLVKIAIDEIQRGAYPKILQECVMYIFIFALAYTILRILSRLIIFSVGRDVEGEIRETLYEKVQNLDASYFDQVPNGEFVSLLTNDTNVVRLLFGMGFLNLANGVLLYTLAALVVFYLNPHLALWAMLPYVFVILLLKQVAPRFLKESHQVQERVAELTGFVQENISGQEVIRNHSIQTVQNARFDAINQEYVDATMKLTFVRALLFTSTAAIGGMNTLLVLWVGGKLVMENKIGFGDFVAFFGYLTLLTTPTLMFGFVLSIWQRSRASLERMNAFLKLSPLTQFPEHSIDIGLTSEAPNLHMKDLKFTYPVIADPTHLFKRKNLEATGLREAVLKGVNLDFIPGRINAIVGRVGSGKTTLVNVLMKRYPLPRGAVTLNSSDINDYSHDDLNDLFAYVPQNPFLFSMSLGENIAFGESGGTNGQMIPEATLKTLAQEMLLGVAEGEHGLTLDTRVGERGGLLSGGQKQRVTLARALLKKAPVLVLDDPFSHLDGQTAQNVMEYLKRRPQTLILITHKISLIKDAAQIIVMNEGEVEQVGSHQVLLSSSKTYRELYSLEELNRDD